MSYARLIILPFAPNTNHELCVSQCFPADTRSFNSNSIQSEFFCATYIYRSHSSRRSWRTLLPIATHCTLPPPLSHIQNLITARPSRTPRPQSSCQNAVPRPQTSSPPSVSSKRALLRPLSPASQIFPFTLSTPREASRTQRKRLRRTIRPRSTLSRRRYRL